MPYPCEGDEEIVSEGSSLRTQSWGSTAALIWYIEQHSMFITLLRKNRSLVTSFRDEEIALGGQFIFAVEIENLAFHVIIK